PPRQRGLQGHSPRSVWGNGPGTRPGAWAGPVGSADPGRRAPAPQGRRRSGGVPSPGETPRGPVRGRAPRPSRTLQRSPPLAAAARPPIVRPSFRSLPKTLLLLIVVSPLTLSRRRAKGTQRGHKSVLDSIGDCQYHTDNWARERGAGFQPALP